MTKNFLLDTNAYYLLFNKDKGEPYEKLKEKIEKEDGTFSFYISEITSLEIHSVLGKKRRGSSSTRQNCTRKLWSEENTEISCSNQWFSKKKKGLSPFIYRDLLRKILISPPC